MTTDAIEAAKRIIAKEDAYSAACGAHGYGSREAELALERYEQTVSVEHIANLARAYLAERELIERLTAAKDGAYEERNRLVAALAAIFPAGRLETAIPGWDGDWHGCVYIDLPTGQASWHYHISQAHLFSHLPPYAGEWDGHTTEEKYARLAKLQQGRKP